MISLRTPFLVCVFLLCAISLPMAGAASPGQRDTAALDAFAEEVAAEHGLELEQVRSALHKARYQQSIIDAMTRPAEAKPWKDYRPIFLNPDRITQGRAFLAEHAETLARIERETGVPAQIVVAILGVETSYGKITGKHRVLDALYTLGFHYPPRQTFFRAELKHLFGLAKEQGLEVDQVTGSYAGAMGWGQFIPSSYRAYARDGNGDGRIDLWNSIEDVFASVANYFAAHGWVAGDPVAVPATLGDGLDPYKPDTMEANFSLADLSERGYLPQADFSSELPATVLNLEGRFGPEYWITFKNFYVISRYNRSPLYSLAVFQLSEMLANDSAVGAAR